MAFMKEMMLVLVLATIMLVSTKAQEVPTSMSCIQGLMPCAQFINATNTPPATCCGPLKKAFETQLDCLCSVFENPELATASNVNMTQAMELPVKCGLKVSDPTNICHKGHGPHGASPSQAPVAGAPATVTSSPGSGSSSGASSVAWAGPISSLMLLFVGLMFY
ncbi:non-specific lipid transfer protein GPI-anchored 9-like isoform X2 [Spinacia oleracea]|uniref:Non-specific lipid transfer protein GPI-anchored 9-like isoform X2 n=1 Tax=Spinacia oleracea TaxID=3562 RepID=A0ABM3QWC3_SPIOL|nr:non-specific lipid transfer protein GPI-anchored 9-like isoform X2 [Spinacia oleracea]